MIRFGLTPTQLLIFNLLMKHHVVSRQMIARDVLGFTTTNNNLNVQLSRMRKTLGLHGIEIVTRGHGQGWQITDETKERVRAMLETEGSYEDASATVADAADRVRVDPLSHNSSS